MLRIGILGAGFMGITHANAWTHTPAQLVGIHALDSARAQLVADEYGAQVYADLDALLADVDVVDVCTPTDTHHALVLKAAAAGKHVICEKPLALTLADGRAMMAACAAAGVHLLVGHVVRFFPEYVSAQAAVVRGDIGRVAVTRLKRCSSVPRWASDNWLFDSRRSGGMILDLMIHDFDYARWIAGEVESVYVRSLRGAHPDASADYALALLHHTNGALTHVEGGWAYPPPMFRTALEIAGDQGLIEHPAESAVPLGVFLHAGETSDSSQFALLANPLDEDPYTTQIRHFHDLLTGAAVAPRLTADDALAALHIGLAAVESARTGRRVRLEEIR